MVATVPRLGLGLALLAAGCSGEAREKPVRGDALAPDTRSVYRVTPRAALAPGQEFALMWDVVRNTSAKPLTIRRVEPISDPGRDAARGVAITLSVRGPRSLPFGFYYMHPPALRRGDTCVVERVAPAPGYVLQPSRAATERTLSLVIRARTRAPGVFALRGQRVVYEQDGRLFYEDIPFGVVVHVRQGARPAIPAEQRACL